MAPTARPCMKGRLEDEQAEPGTMITVQPANRTARPEVASEAATASRGSRPSARPWR